MIQLETDYFITSVLLTLVPDHHVDANMSNLL